MSPHLCTKNNDFKVKIVKFVLFIEFNQFNYLVSGSEHNFFPWAFSQLIKKKKNDVHVNICTSEKFNICLRNPFI